VRSTGLRTVSQLVENAFSHEAKTIVAVGNDDTLQEVINAVGDREAVIGFIPILESEIGKIIGVKNIDQAAKTLGARRVEELDLGRVNNNLFFSKLSFGLNQTASSGLIQALNFRLLKNLINVPSFEIKFSADDNYQGSLKVVGGVIVNGFSDPTDGMLDVLLLSKLSKWQTIKYRNQILRGEFGQIPGSSIIHAKRLEITQPEGLPLKSGSRVIAKTPAVIEVLPRKLKIIVGKDRTF
jgi:diacylglycerol kinase family enzyme